jgi:hypothetical protein
MNRLTRFAWIVALGATFQATSATAQETPDTTRETPNHLYHRYEFAVSGTLVILSTTLRFDPEDGGEATEINIEDDLGGSGELFQPRGTFRWRFSRRHELEAGFLRVVRSNERVLTDTFTFRDTTFAAGLRISSESRTSQAWLGYRYAFKASENSQIGAGVGFGVIFLKEGLDAIAGATSGGPDTAIVEFSREGGLNGPTASLGLYGRFRVGEKWYLDGDLRGLYVKVGAFKAGVVETGGAARYFFSDVFAGEVGYSLGFYTVTLERESDGTGPLGIDFSGKFKYTVQGVRLGLVFGF